MSLNESQTEYVDGVTGLGYVSVNNYAGGCNKGELKCAFIDDYTNCELAPCDWKNRKDLWSVIWIKQETEPPVT